MQTTPGPDRANSPRLDSPRPLLLHLATAQLCWMSSAAALPFWKNGWPDWKIKTSDIKTTDKPAAALPELTDLQAEIAARQAKLLSGIRQYQNHPYTRAACDKPAVWRSGTTRLIDYGPDGAQPLLVIPSLVNRAYILDLCQDQSFVRYLSQHNIRPFLIDWDAPGDDEKKFTLDDYIARLLQAAQYIADTTGQKPALLGYCMGGLFVAALAVLKPDDFAALVLMATPWDFHQDATILPIETRQRQADAIDKIGHMPVDMLQSFFASLAPLQTVRKFLKFADYDMQSPHARKFVQLEDWLNDGVPLSAKVARSCLLDWYGHNTPCHLQWRVGDTFIDPQQFKIPTLAIIPQQDRIVPPESAAALSSAIPGCLRLDPPLGHIGMMSSAKAQAQVWQPLVKWLGLQFQTHSV